MSTAKRPGAQIFRFTRVKLKIYPPPLGTLKQKLEMVYSFIYFRFTRVKLKIYPPPLKLPELWVNFTLYNAVNERPFETVK